MLWKLVGIEGKVIDNIPTFSLNWTSQVMLVVKKLPANAGDRREVGLIPGLGIFPGGEHGNPLQYLAWRIPWTEKSGRLQSIGSQRVGHD